LTLGTHKVLSQLAMEMVVSTALSVRRRRMRRVDLFPSEK